MYPRTCSGSRPLGLSSSTSSRFFSMYSKTRKSLVFRLKASFKNTMFSCRKLRSILTSRMVVFLTHSSSSPSLNFLMATISWVSLFLHLRTTP